MPIVRTPQNYGTGVQLQLPSIVRMPQITPRQQQTSAQRLQQMGTPEIDPTVGTNPQRALLRQKQDDLYNEYVDLRAEMGNSHKAFELSDKGRDWKRRYAGLKNQLDVMEQVDYKMKNIFSAALQTNNLDSYVLDENARPIPVIDPLTGESTGKYHTYLSYLRDVQENRGVNPDQIIVEPKLYSIYSRDKANPFIDQLIGMNRESFTNRDVQFVNNEGNVIDMTQATGEDIYGLLKKIDFSNQTNVRQLRQLAGDMLGIQYNNVKPLSTGGMSAESVSIQNTLLKPYMKELVNEFMQGQSYTDGTIPEDVISSPEFGEFLIQKTLSRFSYGSSTSRDVSYAYNVPPTANIEQGDLPRELTWAQNNEDTQNLFYDSSGGTGDRSQLRYSDFEIMTQDRNGTARQVAVTGGIMNLDLKQLMTKDGKLDPNAYLLGMEGSQAMGEKGLNAALTSAVNSRKAITGGDEKQALSEASDARMWVDNVILQGAGGLVLDPDRIDMKIHLFDAPVQAFKVNANQDGTASIATNMNGDLIPQVMNKFYVYVNKDQLMKSNFFTQTPSEVPKGVPEHNLNIVWSDINKYIIEQRKQGHDIYSVDQIPIEKQRELVEGRLGKNMSDNFYNGLNLARPGTNPDLGDGDKLNTLSAFYESYNVLKDGAVMKGEWKETYGDFDPLKFSESYESMKFKKAKRKIDELGNQIKHASTKKFNKQEYVLLSGMGYVKEANKMLDPINKENAINSDYRYNEAQQRQREVETKSKETVRDGIGFQTTNNSIGHNF